ncbi:hypothetical protein HK100_000370 [Physocladia obscura]|uniref:Uncharacterized protein n=1 Tax=Physocladia obscura TaxID=109957 RepID=A0AAD5SYR0_9FUNG|nr:hypothetical protein HK100_000370 [Physocladia obscura]
MSDLVELLGEDGAILENEIGVKFGKSGSGKTEVLKQTHQQILHLSQQTDPHQKIHNDILSGELILECLEMLEQLETKTPHDTVDILSSTSMTMELLLA